MKSFDRNAHGFRANGPQEEETSTFKVSAMFRASKNEELSQQRGKKKDWKLSRHSASSDAC